MREYIARQKETLATMIFITESYNHPASEVFQSFAERSIAELMEDLLAELTIVLIAHASRCTLTGENVALSMSVVAGYAVDSEKKKWMTIVDQS